ncbi:MAG: carbon-nitrogen hydrolase family protein [Pseudonocardia sp.]|nr:carbon-nitrogen hydrolase family protein [Pseudonocardia sp.]
MSTLRIATVAAPFDRDLEADLARIERLIGEARAAGARLLALPEAALGGYVADLGGSAAKPPAFRVDGPEIARLARLAGDLVVTAGYCEDAVGGPYNAAVCVTGDGVLGTYRKVHQPLREDATYRAGDGFATFDTPVGRIGMQICYDKAFPEAARTLALDGARIIVSMSAWPVSATDPHPDPAQDRWTRRFDLFDRARALENQVVWVASNQFGTFGSLRFAANAKIVDPGGEILAATGQHEAMAVADVDPEEGIEAHRAGMGNLRDRRPELYGALTRPTPGALRRVLQPVH